MTLPDETALQYITATGSSAEALADAFDRRSAVLDVRLLSTTDEYSRFEIHVEPPTVPLVFDGLGGTVSSLIRYEDETPMIVGELPGDIDPRTAVQQVKQVYPDVELVSQELDAVYGTFSFYDTDPRDDTFSDWGRAVVEVLGNWVSSELEQRQQERALHAATTERPSGAN